MPILVMLAGVLLLHMDHVNEILMVSSSQSWRQRAMQYAETDSFVTFLFLYISLVIWCKDKDLGNGSLVDGTNWDVDIDKFVNYFTDEDEVYPLENAPNYRQKVIDINDYFTFNGQFNYTRGRPRKYFYNSDKCLNENSLGSHLYWLRVVRNNVVHGEKSMDLRGSKITSLASELLLALFNEVIGEKL